jgi:phosphate-selective porin OprO/OprP
VLVLSCLVALGAPAAAQDKPQKSVEERLADVEKQLAGDTMRSYWKDGLRFETPDKRYKFKLGGRMHYDVGFFDPDDDTEAAVETGTTRIEDGSEIRRLRLELSGEVGDAVEWATAVDFGGGTTNFRNAYAGVKEKLFGASVRAGQFKEPYGLEQLTSSNNITFIERSLMNAFVPAFNAGLMVYDTLAEERMTWAVGGFRSASDAGEVSKGDGEWATTARITGLATIDEAGDDYVHLALGLSRRSPTQDAITFSSKPEANLAPSYVSAAVPAETVDLIGVEAAWVRGPFSLAGEYTMAMVDAPSGATADPDFSGYYVQAGYFITGENRAYRKAQGCFDTLEPKGNAFGKENGIGAWEVAVRASSIDLADDGFDGGELDDLTFGVNWYLNPNTRVMTNYILADLDPTGAGAEGDTNILEFRVQFAY